MKVWTVVGALVVAVALAAPGWAQCCKASKTDAAAQQVAKYAEKSAAKADGCDPSKCTLGGVSCCAVPTMAYKVGDEVTSCEKTASGLAAEHKGKMSYVVAGREYHDQAAALDAYGEAFEAHLKRMTSVCYMVGDQCVSCPLEAKGLASTNGGSIKYCVAATRFDDVAHAQQAAQAGRAAADKVEMKMVVDGKTYTCPMQAKEVCQKTGKPCEYRVAGCKTGCQRTARVELAKARVAAAGAAIASATAVQP